MVKITVTKWNLVPGHSIGVYLNTQQVKVRYSDKFAILMFAIQIPTVPLIECDTNSNKLTCSTAPPSKKQRRKEVPLIRVYYLLYLLQTLA